MSSRADVEVKALKAALGEATMRAVPALVSCIFFGAFMHRDLLLGSS